MPYLQIVLIYIALKEKFFESNSVQHKLRDNKLLIINFPKHILYKHSAMRIIIIYWCWLHTLEYTDFVLINWMFFLFSLLCGEEVYKYILAKPIETFVF